jgi:hypothetical protein
VAFSRPIVAWSKTSVPPITGAVASTADLEAYKWLRENSPQRAKVLNYPGRYEGQWVPVIAERESVYVRDQLFYVRADSLRKLQHEMTVAYLDPASDASHELMRKNGIDYVVVPHWLNQPSLSNMQLRWRGPERLPQRSRFSDAKYLSLVADFDGAQVWKFNDQVVGLR